MNISSIVNKINIFQSFVYSRFPDIIGVTETWLSDKLFDNEILPHKYSIIRKDCRSRDGGVMFAIKHSKSYQVSRVPSTILFLLLELLIISNLSGSTLIFDIILHV